MLPRKDEKSLHFALRLHILGEIAHAKILNRFERKDMTHAENPTYGFMKSSYIIAATVRAVGV